MADKERYRTWIYNDGYCGNELPVCTDDAETACKLGLGGGMTVIAVILIIVAIITAICVKNNPEEAGEYPDGDPTYAVNGAEIAQMMKEYKSPFTIGKVLKDKNTWFIGLGSALAFWLL